MIDFSQNCLLLGRVTPLKQDRWLVITAGIGSGDFEGAAIRVKDSIEKARIASKVVAVLTSDVKEVCPFTTKIYADYLRSDVHGYGYMCWKAEVIKAALDGKWGNFDGVVWLDAGCEVSINPVSMIRFRYFQYFARKNGVAAFTLKTKEIEYTKRDLFDLFPEIIPLEAGDQIQTTWMLFHGTIGRKVVEQWFDLVCRGTNLLDFSPSSLTEYPEFIQNRNDQSAFSLICKINRIKIMKYRPTSGTGSFVAIFRGLFHPFWTSRNRTSNSVRKTLHKIFEI